MFEILQSTSPDPVMALMAQCKADLNPDKIDLGVGVYKDAEGNTVILDSVKQAETDLWERETTKIYVSTTGYHEFRQAILKFLLGAQHPLLAQNRIASAQTAGGSGAIRIGADIIATARPESHVWVSTPTWANHIPLIEAAGLKIQAYPYYNRTQMNVEFDLMLTHLRTHAKSGDVVLLHGCCHNPTGADFTPSQWDQLALFLQQTGLIPFIDLAYLGLGESPEADSYGLHQILCHCDEAVIAVSCSKNFALYRERVGLVAVVTKDSETATIAQTQLGSIQRRIISMPPHHGAAIVTHILTDANLHAKWKQELHSMCQRIQSLRENLADRMDKTGTTPIAQAIKQQKGMFTTLPITPQQAEYLRAKHAIYILNSGRMNIAGCNQKNIPRLADSLLEVLTIT